MSEDKFVYDVENFLKDFNIEIYKLNNSTTNNNLILLNKYNNKPYIETNLINLYDYLKDINLKIFVKYMFSKFEKYQIEELSEIDLKIYLLNNQKNLFRILKNYVLIAKTNIDGYTFKPVNKRIIIENGEKLFNMYSEKTIFQKITPNVNAKFECISILLKNILGVGYEQFLDFLAWKKQHPTKLVRNHWIIQDDGGTGKTEILSNYILGRLFNINIVGQDDLNSSFNEYLLEGTILICEEIEGYDNEKKIKMLTGSQTLLINGKYKTPFKIKNYSNWIICSNDIKPLKLSVDDTRFNVVGNGLRLTPKANQPWSETFFKSKQANENFFAKFHKNIDKEIIDLHSHLMARKVTRNQIQVNIITKQKDDLLKINYTSEYQFIDELQELNLDNMVEEYMGNYRSNFLERGIITINKGKNKGDWFKVSYFYKLYKNYCEQNGLRPIGKFQLHKRISKIGKFKGLFEEKKTISFENKKFQALKIVNDNNKDDISNYKDFIEEVEEIDINSKKVAKKE